MATLQSFEPKSQKAPSQTLLLMHISHPNSKCIISNQWSWMVKESHLLYWSSNIVDTGNGWSSGGGGGGMPEKVGGDSKWAAWGQPPPHKQRGANRDIPSTRVRKSFSTINSCILSFCLFALTWRGGEGVLLSTVATLLLNHSSLLQNTRDCHNS